jgi:hypothetical protein
MAGRISRDLTESWLKRGATHSVQELNAAFDQFINHHNAEPNSVIGMAKAQYILATVIPTQGRLNNGKNV